MLTTDSSGPKQSRNTQSFLHSPRDTQLLSQKHFTENVGVTTWKWTLPSVAPQNPSKISSSLPPSFLAAGDLLLPSSSGQPLPGWSLVVTFLVTVTKIPRQKQFLEGKACPGSQLGDGSNDGRMSGKIGKGEMSAVLSSLSPLHSDWDPSSQDGAAFIQSGSL